MRTNYLIIYFIISVNSLLLLRIQIRYGGLINIIIVTHIIKIICIDINVMNILTCTVKCTELSISANLYTFYI